LPTGRPCPQCFQSVPLELVWSLTPKGRLGFLAYSTGVVCPSCGAKLRIVQRQSALVLGSLWIIAIMAVEAARRSGVPSYVVTTFAVLVTTLLIFGSALLQRRSAVLKLREGIDTVDFPLERLKHRLSGEAQRDRETELEAAADVIASWICMHCGEPTPDDCPACVNCGRSRPGMT
jgi:hypothetical protein